jgi:hypothetical protein
MDDEWSTDLKKSTLKLPAKVRTTLKKIIGSPIRRSTGVHIYAGKKETENPYWNIREDEVEKKISYEVNVNHSEIKKICDTLSYNLKSSLLRFLASASKNVPLNHIYTTMSKSPKSIDQNIEFHNKKDEEILND